MGRINLMLLVVTYLVTAGISQQAIPDVVKAQVRGYNLQLQSHGGKCVLIYAGRHNQGEITIGLPAPCEFVRDHKGAPQFYSYKGHGNPTVLIITGGPVDSSRSDSLMKEGCGTQIQVISLRARSVKISKVISDGPTVCPSQGLDEKVFGFFAP